MYEVKASERGRKTQTGSKINLKVTKNAQHHFFTYILINNLTDNNVNN